jgi:phospholipase C
VSDLFEEAEKAALGAVEGLLPPSWKRAIEVVTAPIPPTPTRTVCAPSGPAVERLERIEHIVVLMLENRSFDHMLGYLSLSPAEGGKDRQDVDGLRGPGVNFNQADGSTYPIRRLTVTQFGGEAEDPDHSGASVDEQLKGGTMGGFVENFKRASGARAVTLGVQPPEPDLVMRYYTAQELPVYDLLAREYSVVDRWFSSVPGATWPNRLYAAAGRAAGTRDDISPPLYSLPSFARYLDKHKVSWRWYSFDPGTLRLIDPEYRLGSHGNFAYLDARKLSPGEAAIGELTEEGPSFLDDVAAGRLPQVSWIDPRFKDLKVLGPNSNDDHPPSDVRAGQDLVLTIYRALRAAPTWENTLFVITYDEHGGFYDHVKPPTAVDEDAGFQRLGVRVPALLVSPRVPQGRSSSALHPTLHFDHTSIIKTILTRFCRTPDGQIPVLSARVAAAEHLGSLLSDAPARVDVPDDTAVVNQLVQWRQGFAAARFDQPGPLVEGLEQLTDFQSGFYEGARLLRRAGLPGAHP